MQSKIENELPDEMKSSIAWRALGTNHRRALGMFNVIGRDDGGAMNGNLIATQQFMTRWNISAVWAPLILDDLEALGFIDETSGDTSRPRWRATWLPHAFCPPSNEWQSVDAAGLEDWRLSIDGRREMGGAYTARVAATAVLETDGACIAARERDFLMTLVNWPRDGSNPSFKQSMALRSIASTVARRSAAMADCA